MKESYKKVPFTFNAQKYLLPGVIEDWGKGVPIHNFKPEWIEPIKFLQSYITCEGRYSFVFKVLSQFCQKMRIAYLMMIKSLSLMQLGFVLKRNFIARVMR